MIHIILTSHFTFFKYNKRYYTVPFDRMESPNTAKNLLDQTSESIYDTVKSKDGSVHPILFLKKLATKGILEDDPRIRECVEELKSYTDVVTKEQFF